MNGLLRNCGLLVFMIAAFAALGAAQDLGSSNKIFGRAKPASEPKKTKARTPAKIRKANAPASRKPSGDLAKKPAEKPPVRIAPRPAFPPPEHPVQIRPLPSVDAGVLAEYSKLMARGADARRNGDIPSAESSYQHAADLNPRDPAAYISLGELFTDSMRWEQAEKAYRSALSLEPRNTLLQLAFSRVLAQPVASADLSARYDEAERSARSAVRLGNGSAAAYDQLGTVLEQQGLIGAETESAYRQAIGVDPSFAPAHAHLARLLRRKGKSKEAVAEYSLAAANAVDPSQMTSVALSYQSEQRAAESIPLLMTAVHLEPRNYAALVLLGRALVISGNEQSAENNLILASRVSPFSFAAFGELGRLYIRQAKAERAETVMIHATNLADAFERSELAGDFEALGDLYLKRNNAKAAQSAYRSSASLDPQRETAATKLASSRR